MIAVICHTPNPMTRCCRCVKHFATRWRISRIYSDIGANFQIPEFLKHTGQCRQNETIWFGADLQLQEREDISKGNEFRFLQSDNYQWFVCMFSQTANDAGFDVQMYV